MANLSQQKRQRVLEFLQTLREEHKDDDSVLIALGEIESELNAKKYGLVWEQHEEAVDVQMRTQIPVFTEDADREITAVPEDHTISCWRAIICTASVFWKKRIRAALTLYTSIHHTTPGIMTLFMTITISVQKIPSNTQSGFLLWKSACE